MSLRQLVEPECGSGNAVMRLGSHITRDIAYKDEGFARSQGFGAAGPSRQHHEGEQMVNEFLGHVAPPPQTFRMDALLQEMREIEAKNYNPQVVNAPTVFDEVSKGGGIHWASEFVNHPPPDLAAEAMQQQQSQMLNASLNEFWDQAVPMASQDQQTYHPVWVKDFFATNEVSQPQPINREHAMADGINYKEFVNFMSTMDNDLEIRGAQAPNVTPSTSLDMSENWLEDFQKVKAQEVEKTAAYNQQFWDKLQNEWKKVSDQQDSEHPWLNEFSSYYDPYKEYTFNEDNPMLNDENSLEKGKAFLAQGDIPSAVLCFESAARQKPDDPEVWELLGITQAENEMDPSAIAALKRSLDLRPDNMKVLMALAVSFTNESLQSQALKMLTTWLHCNPKYKHLVPAHLLQLDDTTLTSSLIRGPELKEIQNLFLEAVKQHQNEIDPEIQEALGVLFNLSSEYDKAVDCFRAALYVRPDNAKTWNRLGASLANGNRSVEAVDAYQRALQIEPGFIRARYNVGIICMNLKAYKEAAEHLLTALNLQATSKERSGLAAATTNQSSNQMSDTIWSTLRMVISLMGRRDLQEIMDARDLGELNRHFNNS